MMQWTNETIGATDPEYQQGQSALETAERSRLQLFGYFMQMVAERRQKPAPDIVSVLANAKLDGAQLPPIELLSFYYLLVVAGNETTRNATTGGLLALIQHPGELEKLRRDPELIPTAVEEIVRWTSPVIQFCRTALDRHGGARPEDQGGPGGVPVLSVGEPRRGGVPRRRSRSASTATRTRTWASASASTSAWARTWRGSSCRWCSSSW